METRAREMELMGRGAAGSFQRAIELDDNLPAHKPSAVRETIEATGTGLLLLQ